MTPLPPGLAHAHRAALRRLDLAAVAANTKEVLFWRLDKLSHASTWNSGEGAFQVGGRWNKKGTRVLYGALDPATAILEVAVHQGFTALDTTPHVLVCARISDVKLAKVLPPQAFPNPAWLRPGPSSPNQQLFALQEMQLHPILVLPSAVSPHSWNVVIDVDRVGARLELVSQEPFALDTRLVPPAPV